MKEKIVGGLADGKSDHLFDPKQLKKGIKVELEHTDDKEIAKEIAKDHLTEIPNYYDYLEEMEEKARRDPQWKKTKSTFILKSGKFKSKTFIITPSQEEKEFLKTQIFNLISLSDFFSEGDTEIWYAVSNFWFGWKINKDMGVLKLPKTREQLAKTHSKLGSINLTDLNEIYSKMQGHYWSSGRDQTKAQQLIESLKTHTSMSVGDMIIFPKENKAHIINDIGFYEYDMNMTKISLTENEKEIKNQLISREQLIIDEYIKKVDKKIDLRNFLKNNPKKEVKFQWVIDYRKGWSEKPMYIEVIGETKGNALGYFRRETEIGRSGHTVIFNISFPKKNKWKPP